MHTLTISRNRLWLVCSFLLICLTGCAARTTEVSGKITFKGKEPNLKGLRISFMGQDGMPITTEVGLDGSYHASGVPVGEVKVAFIHIPPEEPAAAPDKPARDSVPADRQGEPMTPEQAKEREKEAEARRQGRERQGPPASAIPGRLADPGTSGITTTFEAGKANAFDYDLPEK
jgi:hypothetical protein